MRSVTGTKPLQVHFDCRRFAELELIPMRLPEPAIWRRTANFSLPLENARTYPPNQPSLRHLRRKTYHLR